MLRSFQEWEPSKRSLSRRAFPVKARTGSGLGFIGPGQLPETWLAQAAVAPKQAALLIKDGLGGDGRQLVVPVGLVKRPMGHAEFLQTLQALNELALVRNAVND
jgi:hypothetical protein